METQNIKNIEIKKNKLVFFIGIIIFSSIFISIIYINYKNINILYKSFVENYKIERQLSKNKDELEILTKETNILIKNKTIKPEILNFLKNRYVIKYMDYQTIKIVNIERIVSNNKNYILLELNNKFLRTGTLLNVIDFFYKEVFITKIEIKNKNTLNFYIDEELLEKYLQGK